VEEILPDARSFSVSDKKEEKIRKKGGKSAVAQKDPSRCLFVSVTEHTPFACCFCSLALEIELDEIERPPGSHQPVSYRP